LPSYYYLRAAQYRPTNAVLAIEDTPGATSMNNIISLRAIRNVGIEMTNNAVISGEDISGTEVEVTFPLVDIPAVAVSLLCCAAAGAATSPVPGMIVLQSHLPVTQWETGQSEINGKPLLVLRLLGGCVLTFEFGRESAVECGEAKGHLGATGLT
jgi:hypothetical protein